MATPGELPNLFTEPHLGSKHQAQPPKSRLRQNVCEQLVRIGSHIGALLVSDMGKELVSSAGSRSAASRTTSFG